MLPQILKKKVICILTLLVLLVFCNAQYTIANDGLHKKNVRQLIKSLGMPQPDGNQNNEEFFAAVLQAFNEDLESDDEETKNLLTKWDDYIISASHYSNTDYLNAIKQQQTNYFNVISDINDSIKNNEVKQKKDYSPSWIDDLIDHFGKDFIKTNKVAIIQSLQAISFVPDDDFEKKIKDLKYIEAMLYGSYKDYFGMFLHFYKKLSNDEAQKKLEPRRDAADAFLAIIERTPYTFMHDTTVLRKILAENKARQLNDEVFMFFKTHPLSYTFGDLKALRDFIKVIEN